MLPQLNLDNNELCGLNLWGAGTYTPEGIKSIAGALEVNASLTSLNLQDNRLGEAGAAALAPGLAANGSLTKLSLGANKLEEEGTKVICVAVKGNTALKDLDLSGSILSSNIGGSAGAKHVADMLGVNGSLTSLNLSWNNLRPEGAAALAAGLAANASLTHLDVTYNNFMNNLGEEGRSVLSDAVKGRDGFTLKLRVEYE